ncbi:hypothetical protein KP509_06G034100 [Ceratopteris richardii]|nr:hypothetical protein KP509_06G034100 [Ceratopteris richardii]
MKHGMQESAKGFQDRAGQIEQAIYETAKDAKQKVSDATQRIGEATVETAAQAKDAAKEGAVRAKEEVSDSAQRIGEGTFETAEHAKQAAQRRAKDAKQQVSDTAQRIKDSTLDAAQYAKEVAQERTKDIERGAQAAVQKAASYVPETEDIKQTVQTKAEGAKHGVQEAAEHVKSYIPTAEDIKHGAQEATGKFASYMPSRDAAKQNAQEAKDRVSGYLMDSESALSARESFDSLRSKLREIQKGLATYMLGREGEASYLNLADLRNKLDEASGYLASKERESTYISGVGSVNDMKRGAEETTQKMQDRMKEIGGRIRDVAEGTMQGVHDKARDVGDSLREAGYGAQEITQEMQGRVQDIGGKVRDAAMGSMQSLHGKARDAGEEASHHVQEGEHAFGEYKGKLGRVIEGVKHRFTGSKEDGGGQMERRVHELCTMWFKNGGGAREHMEGVARSSVALDVGAVRDSYGYLMQSALGAIERAQEVFDDATREALGAEWKEKYGYLADSARGALQAAKEVFERTALAAGQLPSSRGKFSQNDSIFSRAENMSRLQTLTMETKQRLSALFHPLVRTLYLGTFSAVYGISVWMTFLSGYLLSRILPRQQLAIVQSKLFPVYLRMITVCVVVCGITHALLHPWHSADRAEHLQYWNFALCMVFLLLNMMVVEPKSTKVTMEKLKLEKEEGRGQSGEVLIDELARRRMIAIDAKMRGFQQMASLLNLANMGGLLWHLWYLGNRLVL